jgi:pilus assembly protein FimV
MINRSFLGFGSLVLVGMAGAAFGLGLSEVEMKSGLNQQLDANIRLLSATPAELESLTVAVTQPESARHTELRHEVINDASGSYIRITSATAIREPVMSFAVEVAWSGGHLTRNYSLLVDPAK